MTRGCEHVEGLPDPAEVCEYGATWEYGAHVPSERACFGMTSVTFWIRFPWTEAEVPPMPFSACEAHEDDLAGDLQRLGAELIAHAWRVVL